MNLVFCLVNRLVETARLEVTDTCTGIAVREMAPNIIWAEPTAHTDLHTADAAQQRFAVVVKAYVCSMLHADDAIDSSSQRIGLRVFG